MPASLLTVTPLTASGISHVGFNASSLTGLILWLDATKIAGISSGASLSAWTDSSASLSHATQPSAASQPTYLLNQQNGNAVVNFPVGGKAVMFSATSFAQPCTIAAAFKSNTTGVNQGIAGQSNGAINLYVGTANYLAYAGTILTLSAFTSGAWVSSIGIFSGSSTTASISGVTFVGNAGTNNGAIAAIGSALVSAQWLNGQIGEVAVYNRAITEAERVSLDTYLRSRWATL